MSSLYHMEELTVNLQKDLKCAFLIYFLHKLQMFVAQNDIDHTRVGLADFAGRKEKQYQIHLEMILLFS